MWQQVAAKHQLGQPPDAGAEKKKKKQQRQQQQQQQQKKKKKKKKKRELGRETSHVVDDRRVPQAHSPLRR
ncbi:hypothetical protein F2P81_004858 [Scophthalmus maximus]|uniref:Uncharacterized protein n=1 Tax=Scophthalmus maximus TaxID=52904 RepID=A0A6A4TKZ8_SCOMX|nr:hypothetical protein F2P81_004858 [Scophthalmus maximus]